jgi:ribokinase
MKVLTIGGATEDVYLVSKGADSMTINKKNAQTDFLLFQSGEKIDIKELAYMTGGGATNTAVTFKKLGFEVDCFVKIGKDKAGEHILSDLAKHEVGTKQIKQSDQHQTGTSFIVNSHNKTRTIFAYRGANGFIQEEDIPYDQIKKYDQLYITSLSNKSCKYLPKITDIAKQHNIPVAINPGTSQLKVNTESLKQSLKNIDTLILNSSEAKIFMSTLAASDQVYQQALKSNSEPKQCESPTDIEKPYLIQNPVIYENIFFSIKKFFQEILKAGPNTVVITNGCNGVYAAQKNKIFFHPSIKTNIVDNVGAGDAFGSCFTASILMNADIKSSLRNGVLNSASVLEKLGAKQGLLDTGQLNEKIKSIKEDFTQEFDL